MQRTKTPKKVNHTQNTALRRIQIIFGAILILLANNLISGQLIQVWLCLKIKINPHSK